MLYVPATNAVILNHATRYIDPATGIVYGKTDYDDPAKLAEIGAVPLRILEAVAGLEVAEWVIEDDTLSIYAGAKVRRPVMLREEKAADGFDALTWETVDDPAHPGDKLKRPLETTPWTITEADRTEKNAQINYSRLIRLEILIVAYQGHNYQADPDSRANLTSLLTAINAGINVGDAVPWRDADDVMRDLTPLQLADLGAIMLAAVTAIYLASWDKKDALAAITDPMTFRAFDTALA